MSFDPDLPAAFAAWVLALAPESPALADSAAAPDFPWTAPVVAQRTRLDSSRAAAELDSQRPLGSGSSSPRGEAALAAARDYRNLGEYETALPWCDRVLAAGGDTTAARREALAAAVALADSSLVVRLALASGACERPEAWVPELAAAYRCLLACGARQNLARLDRRLAEAASPLPPALRYWRAVARAQVRDWGGAAQELALLVTAPGEAAAELTPAQRFRVATALPDLLFLADCRGAAATLYATLAGGVLEAAQPWGQYQTANLDLLAGRLDAAGAAYRRLCARPETWSWKARACALAALADTMTTVLERDGRNGADVGTTH
jgi:hypothetical protein